MKEGSNAGRGGSDAKVMPIFALNDTAMVCSCVSFMCACELCMHVRVNSEHYSLHLLRACRREMMILSVRARARTCMRTQLTVFPGLAEGIEARGQDQKAPVDGHSRTDPADGKEATLCCGDACEKKDQLCDEQTQYCVDPHRTSGLRRRHAAGRHMPENCDLSKSKQQVDSVQTYRR